MRKRSLLSVLLGLVLIFSCSVPSFGATKTYNKTFSGIVGVIEGGTFPYTVKLNCTLTYSDTKSQRKFTKEEYGMVATADASTYHKGKARPSMGFLQFFPGGTRCTQDPNWWAHDRIVSTKKKSYDLNSSAYCSLGYMISGADVLYTRSGSAKWTGIAKK